MKISHWFTIKTYIIFFICLSTAPFAQSAETINTDMKSIHRSMQDIFPLAVSQKNLNKSEMNTIINSIQSMQAHVNHLKANAQNKSDGFNISQTLLSEHLNQINSALQNAEQDYALSLIREIPQMCTACHTQDERSMHFDSSDIKNKIHSDFARGEYHFMTRDYEEALLDYNDHLVKQKKIAQNKQNTEAMEKILLIYIQVFRDTINAKMYFERLVNSEKLSQGLAIRASYWLNSLNKINYSPVEVKDIQTLEKEVNSVLNYNNAGLPILIQEENKVNALWVRSLVYNFMNREPKHPDTPKLLYWLASLESALDYGLSYQLPEVYLKYCIVNYPNHPYAKKCFDQYQLQVEFQYTGSSGTNLPSYKKLELENLKKNIQ